MDGLARGTGLRTRSVVLVVLVAALGFLQLSLLGEISGADVTASPTSPAMGPSGRQYHFMVDDADSGRLILFGGLGPGSIEFDDTWAYDGTLRVWTEMMPGARPSVRSGHSMAYDAESDRVVLFSGGPGVSAIRDTWAYDFDSDVWENMNPDGGPLGMFGARMAYDSQSDRIILFGGVRVTGFGVVVSNETWSYDFNANVWIRMYPSLGPSARAYHAMAYDADSDRVVLFGGDRTLATDDESDETWAYDYESDAWTRMTPATSPSARFYHGLVYDSEFDKAILFGGQSLGRDTNDTWAYDYDTDAWVNQGIGIAPFERKRHAMSYDVREGRVLLQGGLGSELYGGTWEYDYENATWAPTVVVPSAPRDLQAGLGEGQVELSWVPPSFDGSSTVSEYRVYRGGTLLAEVVGRLDYEDAEVIEGTAYSYQVAALNEEGESPRSNQVPVTVPDRTPPTVAVTFPVSSATLTSRSVTVTGTASDTVALDKVEFRVDATDWALTEGTALWSANVTLVLGSNTIVVRATDTWGNNATESVAVTYLDRTDPVLSITAPTDGDRLDSPMVIVTGEAFDEEALEKVEISRDAIEWIEVPIDSLGTTTWSGTLVLEVGENTIIARATDTSGNTGTRSVAVTVEDQEFPSWVLPAAVGGTSAVALMAAILLMLRRSKGGSESEGNRDL
jgi:hypothetical protein